MNDERRPKAPHETLTKAPLTTITDPVNVARDTALAAFDALTDRELGFLTSATFGGPVRLTREQYRACLSAGVLTPEHFTGNVTVMRAVAPRAWGLRVVR